MSGEISINKKSVNANLHIELIARLRKYSILIGVTVTDLMEMILSKELNDRVQLDDSDYEWIAQQVRKNLEARQAKRNGKLIRKNKKGAK